jgi:hypothetical protein
MQAILFYLDVIAFLIVVGWIYGVELKSMPTSKGLLGMREPDAQGVPAPMQPTGRWRQVETPAAKPSGGRALVGKAAAAHPAPPERPAPVTPMPAWRRTLRYGRPPPKV